jgi:hypothetical protein
MRRGLAGWGLALLLVGCDSSSGPMEVRLIAGPTPSLSPSPSPSPTPSVSPAPTAAPSPTPSPGPVTTPSPSVSPAPSASPSPSASPPPSPTATPSPTPVASQGVKAGVAVVDMTPDVGYCAGQYCATAEQDYFGLFTGGSFDPFFTRTLKRQSEGIQSRLTARALVVEGANGERLALLKTDNYLAQDLLIRRVAERLADGNSGIGYENLLHHVTHNHSSAYSSTLAAGVFIFQDVYDARFFEFQARQMAAAIEQAAAAMVPAQMGATRIRHRIFKGNVVGPAVADDGTPAGYPREYGDQELVVMRFDDLSAGLPRPLAVWVNWGQHPEGLDGHDLHSADFVGPLERFIEQDLGVPLVYSQGDVGSAENSGNRQQRLDDAGQVCGLEDDLSACPPGQGVLRDWNHQGYVQSERNVRYLADDIVRAFHAIGAGDPEVVVPLHSDFVVDHLQAWVPGPLSHPYPSVSNCRSEPTLGGNLGAPVLGLPECARGEVPGSAPVFTALSQVVDTLRGEGVPVPDHYDAPSVGAVQENARIRLQVMRLGEVLLASCACEAQVDLILNLKTRLDTVQNNLYNGFDWACLSPAHAADPAYAEACERQQTYFDPAEYPTAIPGSLDDAAAVARMRAQIHNDAAGWDAPENLDRALSEPADPTQILGNFTHEELPPERGYALPVGIGHAGDYIGYVVSYREYLNRDHYRKSLTAYGPHTADYTVTRLVRMAGQLKGGPALEPEPHDVVAQADERRQRATAAAGGLLSDTAYTLWQTAAPDDVGPAEMLVQPPALLERFGAAEIEWRGGSTTVDRPRARVEREDPLSGVWQTVAGDQGEVPVQVRWPEGLAGALEAYSGRYEWRWRANFEAYTAFPLRLGSTAPGRHRFCIEGQRREGGQDQAYAFCSAAFEVQPYQRIAIDPPVHDGTSLRFEVPPVVYPRSYASGFGFIADTGNPRICKTCTFRPWAATGHIAAVEASVAEGPWQAVSCTARADGGRVCTLATAPAARLRLRVLDEDGNRGERVWPEGVE